MKLFGGIINDFLLLTIFPKSSILDIRLVVNMPLGSSFSLPCMKRFATVLTVKSSNQINCQNYLRSRVIKVKYFLLNTHKYFNMEVR